MPKFLTTRDESLLPNFSDLVRSKYASATILAEQVDSERVQRNIQLFQQALLHGTTLNKLLEKKSTAADKKPLVLATIMLIIDTIAEFGSDGGIRRVPYVRDEISKIQTYLVILQNFIQHECRELADREVLNEIPDVLFPVLAKLFLLAECFCNTFLSEKMSFISALRRLPGDTQIQIYRLLDKLNGEEISQSDAELAWFVKPYNIEYLYHLLPIYTKLLKSELILPENKMRILGYIWIRIYEDILSGCGLYSSERAVAVRTKFTSSAAKSGYAVLRHLFVHATEHENVSDEFGVFLKTQQHMLLELGIKLLERVQEDLYSEEYSKTCILLDQVSEFCAGTIYKLKLGIDLRVPFSSVMLRQMATENSQFANSSEYMIQKISTLQDNFERFFAALTKDDQRHLTKTSFLRLTPYLQEKYIILTTFIHHFGICYGTLLKDEIFDVVNQAAKDIGGLDNLDEQLALIRDITIDCIVVRNQSVHHDIKSDIMNMAYRIRSEGASVIEAFCEVMHQLNDGEHISQTFQRARAHNP